MGSDVLDPEEGAGDDPYCDAMPGMEPHNYMPITDLFGSGTWLFCNQCGDYYLMDGTVPNGGIAPGQLPLSGQPQPTNNTSPTTGKVPGFPFP